VWLVARRPRRG